MRTMRRIRSVVCAFFADGTLPIAFKISDAVVVKAVFADKKEAGRIWFWWCWRVGEGLSVT